MASADSAFSRVPVRLFLSRTEQGALRVVTVAGRVQVVEDGLDRCRVDRDVTDSGAFSMNPEVFDAASVLNIHEGKAAQFIPAKGVVEQRGQDGVIPFSL
jgi:hypothetical protein